MSQIDPDLGMGWFEEVWNKGRREAIAEMLVPDAVIHDGGMDTTGPDGFYPFFDRMNATLSEMHVDVADPIAESDRVCVR